MHRIIVSALLLSTLVFGAQTEKRPDNWFNLDPANNNINGVSTERTYKELLTNKKSTTVIVGVIDSGVDYNHEDLKAVMWTNIGEIAGNGVDDDKNGYVDDIHGWNFIGGKDGKNVSEDNLEMTRLVRKLKSKYDGKKESDFKTKEEKNELKLYLAVKEDYTKSKDEYDAGYNQYKFLKEGLVILNEKIMQAANVNKITKVELENFAAEDKTDKQMKLIATSILKSGQASDLNGVIDLVKSAFEQYRAFVESNLNLDFDPRNIVGDDYNNSNERYYGNADCIGPDSFHGTHVSGIIAASRNNGIGMDGISGDVKIMAIRCVPNGDERDKDIANGIRYAVDNGASIINMSFGKKYSWDKKVVDDAVRYAASKGVLIIHAAGNDGEDVDKTPHYPCKKYETKGEANNFMEVGALSWKAKEKMVPNFSNYGKKTVDLFSPGVDIYSTKPNNGYTDASGTSMAAPVATGVAAVLKSYYPKLSPEQIKKILIKSSLKNSKNEKVIKPGTKDELIKFDKLSKSGGYINLYEAVKMAEKFTKTKT
jgi:subtilisin family serine protease